MKLELDDALLVGGAVLTDAALLALSGWRIALLALGIFLIYLAHRQAS